MAIHQEITSRIELNRPINLDALPAEQRVEMRSRYVKNLLREVPGGSAARLLLDKNPSPTASLHLLLRVFPELKVIMAFATRVTW